MNQSPIDPRRIYSNYYEPEWVHHPKKFRWFATILAVFLGGAGAHNLYLGNYLRGCIQGSTCLLAIALRSTTIGRILLYSVWIWAWVEALCILFAKAGFDKDASGAKLR